MGRVLIFGLISILIASFGFDASYARSATAGLPQALDLMISVLGTSGIAGSAVWLLLKRALKQNDDLHKEHELEREKLERRNDTKLLRTKQELVEAIDNKLQPIVIITSKLDKDLTRHSDAVIKSMEKIQDIVRHLGTEVAVLKNETEHFKEKKQ